MENKDLPEAGAIVFFGYKRPDGFEVSLTLRDNDGKTVLTRLEGAIAKVKEQGGTPLPLRSGGFPKKDVKPKDFIEGRVCPKDSGRLYRDETKDGKKMIKCENNRWNFTLKKAEGCTFIEWVDAKNEEDLF